MKASQALSEIEADLKAAWSNDPVVITDGNPIKGKALQEELDAACQSAVQRSRLGRKFE